MDADAALQELGSDQVAFGYVTTTVTVMDADATVPAALYPARADAMSGTTRKLRLGPLPDTQTVKLTFSCPAHLKADLDRYAALHAQTYGEPVDAEANWARRDALTLPLARPPV